MLSNDATIQNIKHEILYEVAKLAYAGRKIPLLCI